MGAASPLAASTVAASPVAASHIAASPMAASLILVSPTSASPTRLKLEFVNEDVELFVGDVLFTKFDDL